MEAVKKRFSKQADHYAELSTLQQKIAKALIDRLGSRPSRILDLGAGCGAVFNVIDWPIERFVAVDFAPRMCELHPKNENIEIIEADFNNTKSLARLCDFGPYELLISSSALQWSADLDLTMRALAKLGDRVAFAFFTDGTFGQLHRYTRLPSFLPNAQNAAEVIARYFQVKTEIVNFELQFQTRRELFSYIRQSGVGGGVPRLKIEDARRLLREYPSLTLEFEVLYAVSTPKAPL